MSESAVRGLIVFLDIDGVLNDGLTLALRKVLGDSQPNLEPFMVENLNLLLDKLPGHTLVLSSSWRISKSLGEIQEIMNSVGFRHTLHSKTGRSNGWRGLDISEWLRENHEDTSSSILILDDDSDMSPYQDRLVMTRFLTPHYLEAVSSGEFDPVSYLRTCPPRGGLSWNHVEEALELLVSENLRAS